MPRQRVLVVGGGLVGLGTAYHLVTDRRRDIDVVVLEKEAGVARHQSAHNSGVLHAGLYYTPGSHKARLAVGGIRRMTRFCEEHGVAHEVCGKLVVAADESEVPRLRTLLDRGTRNGLTGLRWMSIGEAREIEPHVAGVAAVQVPQEGIADYPRVAAVLAELIARSGGRVVTGARVDALRRTPGGWVAETSAGAFDGTHLVTCGGLHADRLARMAGEETELRIVPFRGEYYTVKPDRQHLVRNLIYPVPDPAFPFLGVHFTRRIDGSIEAGPNAVLAFAREGYTKSRISPRDLTESLTFSGLWRFLRKYPRVSWGELRRSFSARLFAGALQRLVPELRASDLAPGGAGVRAMAMRPNGALVEDFEIIRRPGVVHVLNAPSPAATASLAIGEEVAGMLEA